MQACDFHQCARTAGLKDAGAGRSLMMKSKGSRKEERCGRETQNAARQRLLPKPDAAIQRRNQLESHSQLLCAASHCGPLHRRLHSPSAWPPFWSGSSALQQAHYRRQRRGTCVAGVRTQWLRESRVATHGPATAIASVERRVLRDAFLCRWWREVARATGLWSGDGFWSSSS